MKGNEVAMRMTALAGAALVTISGLLAAFSPVAADIRNGRPLAGVVIGTDLVDFARHSDTLMVWHYHPGRTSLDVLSIPRDTKVDIPGYRFRRVNEIFAYHYGVKRDHRHAAGEVMKAVDTLLTVDGSTESARLGLDPHYFVHLDYDGFRRIIDLLGGVEIRVDEPLHYDDNAGDYHLHMEPGVYLLKGADALNYVRFRGRSGDRGRILRQMEFMKAVADRLSSPMLFIRWPRILLAAYRSLHTNFSPWDMLFLAVESKRLRSDDVHPWLLPGRPRGAYWDMDRERLATVLRHMTGRLKTGSPSAVDPKDLTAGSPAKPASPGELGITVKVWNATLHAGLALKATRRLRAAGFDVLEWGNYNGRQARTRVLDRVGDIEKARAVARSLGAEFVMSDVNPRLQTDVEVMLGDDYN